MIHIKTFVYAMLLISCCAAFVAPVRAEVTLGEMEEIVVKLPDGFTSTRNQVKGIARLETCSEETGSIYGQIALDHLGLVLISSVFPEHEDLIHKTVFPTPGGGWIRMETGLHRKLTGELGEEYTTNIHYLTLYSVEGEQTGRVDLLASVDNEILYAAPDLVFAEDDSGLFGLYSTDGRFRQHKLVTGEFVKNFRLKQPAEAEILSKVLIFKERYYVGHWRNSDDDCGPEPEHFVVIYDPFPTATFPIMLPDGDYHVSDVTATDGAIIYSWYEHGKGFELKISAIDKDSGETGDLLDLGEVLKGLTPGWTWAITISGNYLYVYDDYGAKGELHLYRWPIIVD